MSLNEKIFLLSWHGMAWHGKGRHAVAWLTNLQLYVTKNRLQKKLHSVTHESLREKSQACKKTFAILWSFLNVVCIILFLWLYCPIRKVASRHIGIPYFVPFISALLYLSNIMLYNENEVFFEALLALHWFSNNSLIC